MNNSLKASFDGYIRNLFVQAGIITTLNIVYKLGDILKGSRENTSLRFSDIEDC